MTEPYLCNSKTPLLLQVKADLERHEGFREYAYPDPLSRLAKRYGHLAWGYKPARELLNLIDDMDESDGLPWTVGFGFTSKTTPDSQMSRITAERKLDQHILDMDDALSRVLDWYKQASFVTKTILINMAFNMGLGRAGGTKGLLGFRNTLRYIKEKNYYSAAHNMTLSKWFRQTGSRAEELVARMSSQTIAPQHKAPERL